MEERGITSIALSTKEDVLQLIGEAKFKSIFGRQCATLCITTIKITNSAQIYQTSCKDSPLSEYCCKRTSMYPTKICRRTA